MKILFSKNVNGMTEALQGASIGIAGCGGLGSNTAVALVRAGLGKIVIVDFDKVEESNLNRQYFFQKDLGKNKTEALAKILKSVNPDLSVEIHTVKLDRQNFIKIYQNVDVLIEAFDRAEEKTWLLNDWCKAFPKKPIISGNGLSGVGKTGDLKVSKVGNIYFCGDGKTELSLGLCSARVAIVANMQANAAIELLMTKEHK